GVVERHARATAKRTLNLDQRCEFCSGKDVLLDPIASVNITRERALIHADGLNQHGSIWLEQTIAGAKKGVVIGESHCLEHFDRYDLVVLALKAPVVLEEQLNLRPRSGAQSGFGKPGSSVLVLL